MQKSIIALLAALSLPVHSTTVQEAIDVLGKYGIAAPTVMVDAAVYTGNSNRTNIDSWILDGFTGDSNFILHQGASTFYKSNMENGNGYSYGIRNSEFYPGHIVGSGLVFGKFRVNMNNAVTGAQAYERYVGGLMGATENLFYESDDVMDKIGGTVIGIIKDKAENVGSIVRTMGYQVAATNLGKSAEAACEAQFISEYINPACTAIGNKFVSISNKVKSTSGILSEDNIVYKGETWYRDYDAEPWWESTDANTKLGIYRLRKADDSWRMETKGTGLYMRNWNKANTDTGDGWSPEVEHATAYNDNLDAIEDLTDALITLDGESFGDIFNE